MNVDIRHIRASPLHHDLKVRRFPPRGNKLDSPGVGVPQIVPDFHRPERLRFHIGTTLAYGKHTAIAWKAIEGEDRRGV
jgi:hypothetical protein